MKKKAVTLELALVKAASDPSYLSRFQTYIRYDPDTDCDIWKGSCRGDVPQYSAGRGGADARKLVWYMAGMEIPSGDCLKPKCGDNRCVNVKHLKLVKIGSIIRDTNARARRKLTWTQAQEIREKYKGDMTLRELGKEYGASFQQIQQIVTFKTYAEE
jgi:hypothetical protein